MFNHPDHLMTLATDHLHELKVEHQQWQFATKLMQAQQTAHKHQPNKPDTLRNRISQFFNKLARPTWATVVKQS